MAAPRVISACEHLVESNGELLVQDFASKIIGILSKSLDDPNPKFRKLRARSKVVEKVLLAAEGGRELLLALGFKREALVVESATPAPAPSAPTPAADAPSGAPTVAEAAFEQHVDALAAMGYKRSKARAALRSAGGDLGGALDALATTPGAIGVDDEAATLAEARELSRLDEARRAAAAMRAAAAPPPPVIAAPATRAEDYYVLSDAALTAKRADLEAARTFFAVDVPARVAAKKDEAKKALQAKIRRERAASDAERATSARRWREDASARAEKRNKAAAAPRPRDAVGEEIDAQDAAFAASAAADGGGAAPKAAPAPSAAAHATVTVSLRRSGAPATRRDFLASWTVKALADHLARQRNRQLADGAVVVTLVVAGRGALPPDDTTLAAAGLHGATVDVREAAAPAPAPEPEPQPVVDERAEDAAYAAALACDAVAAVEGLRPAEKDVAGGAVPKRLVRELRSLARDLPVHAASSVLLRFDADCPLYMRALITGPPRTPYEHGCFEFEVECPADYPAKPPRVRILTTKRGTLKFGPNLYADGLVCLSLLGTWPGPGWDPNASSLLQVLISIQGLVLGTRHPHFNEPGHGGWEGTETDHGRVGRALSTGEEAMSHVPPDARKTDEVLAVQTLDGACAHALAARREGPFGDAILRHFEHKKAAIAQTVEARCFEADAYYADTAEAFKAALRGAHAAFLAALGAAAAEPRAPAAPRESSTDRDIAKLEAQLEDLRRRKLAEDAAAAMDTDEAAAEDDDAAMDDGGGDDMDEDDDDDDDGDDAMGYAGPEKFAGAGRTLASAPPPPPPPPPAVDEAAVAAAEAAAARRRELALRRFSPAASS